MSEPDQDDNKLDDAGRAAARADEDREHEQDEAESAEPDLGNDDE
jgi:hypothetical protein